MFYATYLLIKHQELRHHRFFPFIFSETETWSFSCLSSPEQSKTCLELTENFVNRNEISFSPATLASLHKRTERKNRISKLSLGEIKSQI